MYTKQNMESQQMTRTAKASVLCGSLIVAAGCIASFVPQLQMIALAFMFLLNTGLHMAVWRRSVKRGTQMGATLSMTLTEAWFLLMLLVFFSSGKPSAALLLAAYAFYQITHGSSLLTIPTGLSRTLGVLAFAMGTLTLFIPVPAIIGAGIMLNGAERLIMALVNRNDQSKANKSLTGQ